MTSPTLPPWITPTLPTPVSPQPTHQLPPHITPTLPQAGTIETTTPSGLVVVRHELSQVTRGSKLVVAGAPLEGDAAVDAATQAHAELAASHGTPAADVLYGTELELVQGIRNDELRAQAVAALLAGDLAGAAALIAQQG